MKQKEAVSQALVNVCGRNEGGAYTPTTEQRKQVAMILIAGFVDGTIDHKSGPLSEDEASKYVPGLISNWLRKDKELNGGIVYMAKNPGSRSGSSDPSLKAMRVLLDQVGTAEGKAEVQAHIDSRLAEISASKKAKSVKEIDFSSLPADLQKFATIK
jgi:hypothetical protein